MKYLKLFESSDKDLTDSGNSLITSDRNIYKKVKDWYGIDKEDIRNIFQEILDIYPNLVMDVIVYHNRNGLSVFFYDSTQQRFQSVNSINYPIEEDLLEEIFDQLGDYEIEGKFEYDTYFRYFSFRLWKV